MNEALNKNVAEGEERYLLTRAFSLFPHGSADLRFAKKLQDYFVKWGWLTNKQKLLLARVIARHAELPMERKRLAVRRICVICKICSIHPNDSHYDRRICISCVSDSTQVPGPNNGPKPLGQPTAGSMGEKVEIENRIQEWRAEANSRSWSKPRRKKGA